MQWEDQQQSAHPGGYLVSVRVRVHG
jgi:hypothetical protein